MAGVLKKRQALHTLKISKIYLKAEAIIDSDGLDGSWCVVVMEFGPQLETQTLQLERKLEAKLI